MIFFYVRALANLDRERSKTVGCFGSSWSLLFVKWIWPFQDHTYFLFTLGYWNLVLLLSRYCDLFLKIITMANIFRKDIAYVKGIACFETTIKGVILSQVLIFIISLIMIDKKSMECKKLLFILWCNKSLEFPFRWKCPQFAKCETINWPQLHEEGV